LEKKIRLTGKSNIEISRDAFGIQHIEAKYEMDLYKAMGYCHAMDRGLQMLLMRILGRGEASEFLESSDELLDIDIFFRRINFAGKTDQEISKLPLEAKINCSSYCDGVNLYFSKKVPWELSFLLQYQPTPWKIEDSILVSRMIGYLTLAQSQFEIERLLVEMVQSEVPRNKLDELFPGMLGGLNEELIRKLKISQRIIPDGIKWDSIVPRIMASNNWIVAGNRTKSGKPILANDPHLETNRLPNVWYEMVLKMKERYAIASTMPGLPGILLGRTSDLAWGATYSFMDTVDSWVEHCKDGKYLKEENNWAPFRQRQEVIRRKHKKTIEMLFYENERGVLDGNPAEEGYYLTTRWFPVLSGARSLSSIFRMWEAKNVEEGMNILGNLETSWNWVLADKEGNIGYQMSGMMPKRKPGNSGFVPLPGWEKESNYSDFVQPEDLPRCLNPEQGYFVTANNNLNQYGKVKPINICMSSYRADRISQLLENASDLTVQDCFSMHYDVYSLQAEKFMKILKPLLPATQQGEILEEWDCNYLPESEGAYLFEVVYHNLLKEVFGKNGVGSNVADFLIKESGIFIDFYDNFDRILLAEQSAWFGAESRDQLYKRVIDEALNTPVKKWKESQKLYLTNIFFGGKLPKFLGFDKGPVVIRGGRATVQQGQIYRSGGRTTSFTPSFRMVTDLSLDESHTNMAGGPSDRRFSKWYISELKNWLSGKYKVLRP
jgi:penicillin amidase